MDQPQAYAIHACEHSWADHTLIHRIGAHIKRRLLALKNWFN
jgi:hypothetical protein